MKNIEGFVFFDKSLDNIQQQMPIFGAGTQYEFTNFQTNLKTFQTPQEAAKKAKKYYWKFEKERIPTPTVAKLKIQIPDSLKEEKLFQKQDGLIIIVPQGFDNYVKLIGAPIHNRQRYCNTEIRASELINNRITPYHSTAGETAYEIASEARSEIARQSEQSGIFIAKFSLIKHTDSTKLIHYP